MTCMFTKILMIPMCIRFDDTIADIIKNKKLNSIVNELFISERKLNIYLVFITQSYVKAPREVRLNTTHFLISKIQNKRELQQIAINHSSDISIKVFEYIYRKCTAETFSFFVNDTRLASNNPLRFRKNLFNIECNSLEYNIIINALESLKPKEQTKATSNKSNDDNTSISKEIYQEILEEWMKY